MSSIKHILLSDISSKALRFSRINAALNGFDAETRLSDVLLSIPEKLDLIVSNPPYLADRGKRMYRDGGGTWGIDLSVRIVKESLSHLTAEGKFVLYTGTPIVAGIDQFKQALIASLGTKLRCFRYEEIDPDVFGEELAHSPYDQADRIAAVFLVIEASDIDV
jgi:methylase of polypeptide subunit release factors